MRFTSYIPALDMLTSPLVLLSKPVGPIMSFLRRQESLTFLSKNAFRNTGVTKTLLRNISVGLSAVQGTCLYP